MKQAAAEQDRHGGLRVVVQTGATARFDKPVEVALPHADWPTSSTPVHVVEVDEVGHVLGAPVPAQLDSGVGTTSTLIFLLTGETAAHRSRRYLVKFGAQGSWSGTGTEHRPILLLDDVEHEGQISYRIETVRATYLYHKLGGGFASLLDLDGDDWISFHPWGGPDGQYRGIPNLVHPEGYFHPGNFGCSSKIVSSGPLKVTLESTSNDGEWVCRWAIYPEYATLTVLKAARPYWFLYEGTPAGVLNEESDTIVRCTGQRTSAAERWAEAIPAPEWLYFGARDRERVLYLAHHEPDEALDSYWPMEHTMTVFGFGRLGLDKFLTATPNHFTIGLVESADFAEVAARIASACAPIEALMETVP